MPIKVTTTGVMQAQNAIADALNDFMTTEFLTIGIHEEAGDHPDSDITNAQLGAVHEFGADINHPGGTNFGFNTEQDASDGKVRFLPAGQGFAVIGTTGPHQIKIPARPWLKPGVMSGQEDYLKIIENGAENGDSLRAVLNRVGPVAVGKVQEFMTQLRSPPNAASTVAKKQSSNPLIDSGALRQSVTFQIQAQEPDEGI